MTLNASVMKQENGQFKVTAYKAFLCPACERLLCELQGNYGVMRIACSRCKAIWRLEDNKTTMVRPPRHVAGKNMLDVIEKHYKK